MSNRKDYPPEVPTPQCWRLQKPCGTGYSDCTATASSCQGKTSVSSSFIRNRGVITEYDCSPNPNETNNPPPVHVYVRITNSEPKQFIINGKISPRLLLKRGGKYQFNIVTDCCDFYFSSKPKGKADIFGIPPISYDTRTYRITDNVPARFYYTSSSGGTGLTGEVIIIEN